MEFIKPSATVITESDVLKRVELCGRVCYKSEDKITDDSALRWCKARATPTKDGVIHGSVFEHAIVNVENIDFRRLLLTTPVLPWNIMQRTVLSTYPYGAMEMNVRDYILMGGTIDSLIGKKVTDDCLTVRFVTSRDIWYEIRRHRSLAKTEYFDFEIEDLASYSQESTRYCDYDGKRELAFVYPAASWCSDTELFRYISAADLMHGPQQILDTWVKSCKDSEKAYKDMRAYGAPPQEARAVLNGSTKTEIVMTGQLRLWEEFIKLRASDAAHPDMRQLMYLLTEDPNCPDVLRQQINSIKEGTACKQD